MCAVFEMEKGIMLKENKNQRTFEFKSTYRNLFIYIKNFFAEMFNLEYFFRFWEKIFEKNNSK